MITTIVSGGQTGVDRAALDAAIELGIPHGGWCPKGRWAEDGVISSTYKLIETESSDVSVRTKLNIKDSDGTLIFVPALPLAVEDGTILTIQEVKEKNKPYLIVDLSKEKNFSAIKEWVNKNNIRALNVAGPRESTAPGIYKKTFAFLEEAMGEILEKTVAIRAKL